MTNNLFKLEKAMNLIKEDLVRDLSDSVIEQGKNRSNIFKNASFSERNKD